MVIYMKLFQKKIQAETLQAVKEDIILNNFNTIYTMFVYLIIFLINFL